MADDLVVREFIADVTRDICELNYDPLPGQHPDEVRLTLDELSGILGGHVGKLSADSWTLGKLEIEYSKSQAQLAAMTAERDELQGELLSAIAERDEWERTSTESLVDAQEKLTASEAALQKYGRHLDGCGHSKHSVTRVAGGEMGSVTFGHPCTCGLAHALGETREG